MNMPASRDILDGCTPIAGGYIVQQNDDFVVDVIRTLYNWRVHVALAEEYGAFYLHGFCYFGTGPETLARALAAAKQWADPLNTEPDGFDKEAF